MTAFKDFSITNKIRSIVMIVCSIALLMACGILGALEVINFRETQVHELSILSQIVADRCTASLAFDDPKIAHETLDALKVKDSIVSAYILNNSGEIFATYYRQGAVAVDLPDSLKTEKTGFDATSLNVVSPVFLQGEKIGTVFIRSDLGDMYGLIWKYIGYVALTLFLAILTAFFMLTKLQRFISRPILDLANAAGMTAINMDYSTRVKKTGNDEIGLLVDAFNAMMDQIKQRDLALIESKNRAEASARKARDLAKETSQVNVKLQKEIAERKRIYTALLNSEKKYRGIFENAQEGIFRTDAANRFIDVNPSMAKLLGYDSPADLIHSIYDIKSQIFIHDTEYQQFFSLLKKNDKADNFECRLKRKDNQLIWGSVQALAFRDEANHLTYIEGLVEDITERKLSEKKLKNAYKQLEQRVEERTAELRETNRELRKAIKAADEAANAKSEFLANMSHEIRTPMNGVISAAELALSEEIPLKVEHYLKIIHSSGNALLGIINDILDFSKIDSGKLVLDNKTFRLDVMLQNTITIFSSVTAGKNIELLLDIRPETPMDVIGDPLRYQQVLTNLIGNAVKFTDRDGMILIEINSENLDPDSILLTCSVKDTGIGMRKEQRDLLFQAFTQGDTSTTRKFGGTGLGLCISQQIVERMNGQIFVESEFGKGSKFTVSTVMKLPPDQSKRPLVLPENLKGLNVLIVDDSPESRGILSSLIERFGFYEESAASGMSAITLLKESRQKEKAIDLAVIDMKMPGMDGLETAMEIRGDLNLKFPIILMTSAFTDFSMPGADTTAIDGFIAKPVTASSLFNAIMDILGEKPIRPAAPETEAAARHREYKTLLNGLKILVAEDNRVNQELAVEILKSIGITVRIASDGAEAVKAVSNETFDAVLMDIQMPNMDGYEATRRIREIKDFQALPIIAMTASAMMSDEKRCRDVGMNGFVPKPIRQENLFGTLLKFVRPGLVSELSVIDSNKQPLSLPEKPSVAINQDRNSTLPGLNVREAAKNMNLDIDVYKKILSRFLSTNIHTMDRFRTAANQNQWKNLQSLAHSLKGSSGNIGADPVREAVEKIEQYCRNLESGKPDKTRINLLLNDLEQHFNRLLSSIKTVIQLENSVDADEIIPDKIDNAMFMPVLSDLIDALKAADPIAIKECLDRLKHYKTGFALNPIETRINEYDYDDAIEMVAQHFKHMDIKTVREIP